MCILMLYGKDIGLMFCGGVWIPERMCRTFHYCVFTYNLVGSLPVMLDAFPADVKEIV